MADSTADVVIIGGGIAGCATAYNLAKLNVKVVIVEKGNIGDEQSGRAWGFVRQQGRDPVEMPMMIACNKIWQGLSQELNADLEWVQGGNLALAKDGESIQRFEESVAISRQFGLDTRLLSRDEVRKLIPSMEGSFIGGMYTPGDGHAEPIKTTTAFARAAQEHGAEIYTGCAAEGIEITGGKVSAVITERGIIRTPVVVCAAGAWSSKIGRMAGLSLPQRVVRATVAETHPVPPVTQIGVWAPGVSFRQRPNGSFYIAGGGGSDYDVNLDTFRHLRLFLPNYLKNRGLFRIRVGGELVKDIGRRLPGSPARKHPFAHSVGVEPRPNPKTVQRTLKNFVEQFPSLSSIGIKRVWAGRIDATPDAVPVLGAVDKPEGFLFATGFSGHGFAMGPIVGIIMSQLIVNGESEFDIHPMRYNRFKEGDLAKPRNVL
ncbi:MAG: FAD-binding oxidoreductase [Chloroflexi bacterium]|nr:FAD-binding oxidoreductase [Chloroflexota bacterium]